MRILAVDPGLATGVATYENGVFDSSIWPYPDVMMYLESTVPIVDAVAFETFTITARTLKLSRQYEPLELIGLVKYLAWKHDVEIVGQAPADAKSFVKNDRLKQLGWYAPGAGHDNDAARHLLLYIANHHRETFKELIALQPA